jgi:hypothetical protein
MRTLAGPDAHIHFSSLSESSTASLSKDFHQTSEKLADAQCHQQGILDLIKSRGINLDRVCLLDPKAEQALSPEDGDERFYWFLFGVRRPPFLYFCRLSRLTQLPLGNSRCFLFSVSRMRSEFEIRNYRRRPSSR